MHTGEIELLNGREAERDDMVVVVEYKNLSEDTITTHSICDGGEKIMTRDMLEIGADVGRSEHVQTEG